MYRSRTVTEAMARGRGVVSRSTPSNHAHETTRCYDTCHANTYRSDNNTLRLTNGDVINAKLVKGFIMYLRSWGTITNNAKRDAQTEGAIQQIINTGITGEARTSSQQPAPHLRNWGQKVQCSLIAVTQLTRELDPEVSVIERLTTIIGAGTVTECSNACCQALLDMIKSVDTVARLAHSPVLTERTDKYDSSPTNVQQFWSIRHTVTNRQDSGRRRSRHPK